MEDIIICDITILLELFRTVGKRGLDTLPTTFHAVRPAIDRARRTEAEALAGAGALVLHELQAEEDTLWIMAHCSGGVSFGEMSVVRYALAHRMTMLTDDPVLTVCARSLGASVVDSGCLRSLAGLLGGPGPQPARTGTPL